MKKKLLTLAFGLLLAVGWTSSVSAQALSQGGYAERLGLRHFVAPMGVQSAVTVQDLASFQMMDKNNGKRTKKDVPKLDANVPSQGEKAPARPTYAPLRADAMGAVPPKSYYADLKYSWSNPVTGESGTDVPSTQVAKDPYQIYELLRFVYMDKRFPGPYYNAYTSTGVREDPVYYGGIEGGWDIPYGTGSGPTYNPVGDITISVSSYYESFNSITVYDYDSGAVLTSWDASSSNTESVTIDGDEETNYILPTGWSKSTAYFLQWTANNTTCAYLSSESGGTITIAASALQGATHVRVVINAITEGTGTSYLTVNNERKALTTSFANYEWEFQGTPISAAATTPTDVLITTSNTYAYLKSISVSCEGTSIGTWNASNGTTLPNGWVSDRALSRDNLGSLFSSNYYGYIQYGGTIRIPASKFEGHNSVTVTVVARAYTTQVASYLQLNDAETGKEKQLTSQDQTFTYTIDFPATVPTDTYKPNLYEGKEGYTALIVSVKNKAEIYPEPSSYLGACEFTTKQQVIDYIAATIDSVQLLTDGLRIGTGEKTGTVFNCDGTYNKFFFLSKGRARKKSSGVLSSIGNRSATWPSYAAEEVPFKFMFEQFSPTGGEEGDQIYDFYSEMIQGHTYPIVHDCASVLQNGHQFSMSGNTGETYYGMRGLNFFIPDYRLKYYELTRNLTLTDGTIIQTIPYDGRDMNPYMMGEDKVNNAAFNQASYFAVWYAQYNPTYAPKVGLYLITLEAEAHPCDGYDEESNHYYEVTLNWTSSLNEMSGENVPQTYTIYEVVYNPETNEDEYVFVATVDDVTTYTLPCPPNYEQEDHSKTHTYIIKGSPRGENRPAFVAWSNQDDVVIPGLKDFLALQLDHAESDFKIAEEKNWYRNFLVVKNENDLKALTTANVNDGMHTFTLYRYEDGNENSQLKIADIEFTHPIAANATRAKYTVTYNKAGYEQQVIEPYNINKPATANSPAINIQNAYERETMGIPDEGELSIKGSGDIIIWPSGYNVNFLSIKVTNGNGTTTTWTPASYSNGNLPNGWRLSPGCRWIEYEGAYYLEGMGYIYIPAGTSGNATVVIKAYGDGSSRAKVTVNDVEKTFPNGAANAEEKDWTVAAANRAPMRATTEVTFTAGTDVANAATITKNGVTITNTQSNTNNNSFSYNPYRLYAGSVNISTSTGKITKIVFNGNSSTYPISRIQGLTNGTWTGDATSVNLTTTGQARCTSIVVTVATDEGGGDTPSTQGMIRLAIPVVDQFNASTATNSHAKKYTYVLKYGEGEDAKPSNTVDVDVQHTDSKVWGYYNTDSLDNDIDRHLKTDVMTADIQFTLSKTETAVFYNTIQGKANALPAEYKNYETILQRLANGEEIMYQEMKNPSPLYHNQYNTGIHNHYDSIATQGTPGQYKSYVPSITTMGHNRRYYEVDTLHNTYGAPIWKTGVGQVTIINGEGATEAQWQDGKEGSTHWTETVNGVTTGCNLYFLGVEAKGYLPSSEVSNVKYEPHMFRVWIESPNNNLRGCRLVAEDEDPNKPGEHWDGDGTAYGKTPVLIYEGPVTANNLTDDGGYLIDIDINNDKPWNDNIWFGAVDGIDDLKVYVRFYFKSTGEHVANPQSNSMRGLFDQDDEVPVFYATEDGKEPSPTTGINGIFDYNAKMIDSVTYVNTQGMKSDKPFDGINIVITRYTDGTTRTTKVVR